MPAALKRLLFVVFSLFAGSFIILSIVAADSYNVCLEDGITPCRWFVTGTSAWISARLRFPVKHKLLPHPIRLHQ
jgi:hypothetical protein